MIPAGTYLVGIEGDGNATETPGNVQTIFDLSGLTLGANGYLVLLPGGSPYPVAPDATVLRGTGSGFTGVAGFQSEAQPGVDFENASVTLLLITAPDAPTLLDDIDPDETGVPSGIYDSWEILDSVGIADDTNTATNYLYAAISFVDSRGLTSVLPTSTTITTQDWSAGYVGRIGESTGSAETDWVASLPFGTPPSVRLGDAPYTTPVAMASQTLGHIGALNTANLSPVAAGVTATTLEGISVLIDVLGSATDPDGDELALESVSVPAHGTAEIESGQVRYAPESGFVGEDAFTYTVSDGLGGTAEGPVTITVTEGSVTVTATPEGPMRAGDPATIAVSVSGFTPTTARLHYRPGGATGGYASVPLAADANGYRAAIPAEAVTLRGVDYYAELSDGDRTTTFPAGAPEAPPAHLRVTVAQQAVAASPSPDGSYRMVSVPVALRDASPEAVFADDYGAYGPTSWRALRWSPAVETYAEYPSLGTPLAPGVALWLATFTDAPFDVDDGTSMALSPVDIVLQPGWNQIGSPFAFSVAWSSIAGTDAVEPPVAWDGVEYLYDQDVLEPWAGYFVRNGTGGPVTLTVAPEATDGARLASARAEAAKHAAAYQLRLGAVAPERGLRDTQNALGFASGASGERGSPEASRRDLYEAPSIGEHLRLSVLGDGDARLAHSYRQDAGGGAAWEVEVAATPSVLRAGEVSARLTLAEEGERPAGYEVFVFDAASGAAVPVQGGEAVLPLTERAPTRRLRVVVGTAAFAEEARGAPTEAALRAAYPNPASGAVTLAYDLAEAGRATLEVFDALGRRVAVLTDGEQAPGRYEVRWEPRGVASGVYLYRLRAGSFVATRRLQILH